MTRARGYTEKDEQMIKALHQTHTAEQIGALLGRSSIAIQKKASMLNLPRKISFYTKAEDNLIIQHYKFKTAIEVALMLPYRSVDSILHRAASLGCRFQKCGVNHHSFKYSNEDVELMRSLRDEGLTFSSIGEKFEIIPQYVGRVCRFNTRQFDSLEDYHQSLRLQDAAIDGRN